MGLFSKKSDKDFEKLPELPQLPRTISMNPALQQPSTLPSLPSSDMANRWSMQAVKAAMNERDPTEVSEMDDTNSDSYNDFEEISSGEREVIGSGMPRIRPTYSSAPARREPLFIRIDRFESAIRDFEEITAKIRRIEDLISDIRALREREDREFQDWEKDLQSIRARLDSIDRTLFDQLD